MAKILPIYCCVKIKTRFFSSFVRFRRIRGDESGKTRKYMFSNESYVTKHNKNMCEATSSDTKSDKNLKKSN